MNTKQEKIAVLHIITGLGMGGAEKVVYDLCLFSKETEITMHLISLSNEKDREADFRDLQIPVHVLGITKNLSGYRKSFQFIKQYIANTQIDVIHVHMTHGLLVANWLNFIVGIPVVFTAHSYNVGSRLREYYLNITKRFRTVDILFSKSQLRYYHKQNDHLVIPNGIDLEPFDQLHQNIEKFSVFTFIHIGRLLDLKNQALLITSAKHLRDKGKSFQLLIVGDGPKREFLEDLVRKYSLKDHISFLGIRKDIPELLTKSHVFLLSSRWEGFPISILEAGAARLTVLTTDVGGISDMIPERCGVLASEKDYIDKMEAIFEAYEPKYKYYGENLYQHIRKNYGMNTVFERHVQVYDQLKRK